MKDIRKKIEDIAIDDSSQWLEKAKYRRKNRGWLRKSQEVAIRVLGTLKEKGMQQKELAETMDVSPQQVSKIVQGKENLTLQTIAKLEAVLGISLFEVPKYHSKVEVNKPFTSGFEKGKGRRFAKQESFKKVAHGSWSPSDEISSNMRLVKV
ncbi:MAG TPA: helix-turn-helix transcriptional regulator [Balneolaceae bacterium]|nr:helix-turn-helix transcriptional regulator [Balneolaceae bacterium]